MSTPTAQSPLHSVAEALEGASVVDGPAKPLGRAVRNANPPGAIRDLLSGTWLGHALHPILTDVVIGSWTSATILDLIGGRQSAPAAERLIGVGIAAYGPTALTGVTDWADSEAVDEKVRRLGVVHAVTNATALALYSASLVHRRKGNRGRGVLLGLAGAGALGAGGWIGGHLSYVQGVGVNQTKFDEGSKDWTAALPATDLPAAGAAAGQAGETPVLLVREAGGIAALHDRCSHRGCSLSAKGEIADGAITCGCHGSRFRLSDGALLRGPATSSQPAFDARERDGMIEVRAR